MNGWICRRCGISHGPYVQQCSCPPPTITTTGASEEPCGKCGGSGYDRAGCVKHEDCRDTSCEGCQDAIPCPACQEPEPCNICNDTGHPYIDCQNEYSGYDLRHFCLCPLGQYKKTEKKSNSTYFHSDPTTKGVEKRTQDED